MALEKRNLEAALRVPANPETGEQPEASLYPPVGQLPYERIEGANETTVDQLLFERHGFRVADILSRTGSQGFRKIALKRLALARLEGIDRETLADRSEVLGSGLKVGDSISSVFVSEISGAVRERIKENANWRIRFAALQSDPALRDVLKDIVRDTGIPLEALFRTVPEYRNESSKKSSEVAPLITLEAYYLRLNGSSWQQVFEFVQKDDELRVLASDKLDIGQLRRSVQRAFSKEALEKLPRSKRESDSGD